MNKSQVLNEVDAEENNGDIELRTRHVAKKGVRRSDIHIEQCGNKEADNIFLRYYWMKRVRRSRRLSYGVFYGNEKVAWIQVADPFGTRLKTPLQTLELTEVAELCRGYFAESAPANTESCAIAMILRALPNDWYIRFGEIKKIAVAYQDVDARQRGIVYKALGFKTYGRCPRARHYMSPTRGNSSGNKMLWVRRLRPISGKHYQVTLPASSEAD